MAEVTEVINEKSSEQLSPQWVLGEPVLNISVTARAAQRVAEGNLWIFSNEVQQKFAGLKKGAWCRFVLGNKFVGFGYCNPHSLIFGRVISFSEETDIKQLIERRLTASLKRRESFDVKASGRLVFSEADFIPGLILDFFSGVAVLQSNTAGIDSILPILEEVVPIVFKKVLGSSLSGLVFRGDSSIRRLEGLANFTKVILGSKETLEDTSFVHHDVRYAANFFSGQKTGFFLDQAENRLLLKSLLPSLKSAQMLDLFCYSGGWGLQGLQSGASSVTFVDESSEALDLVKKGIQSNNFSSGIAQFVKSDVFDFLSKTPTSLFDVVVVDPPAFVKSKKNLPQAIRAYEKLNRLAWRWLKPGGILVSCSCSFHLGEPDFLEILKNAVGKEKGLAHVLARGKQASDHPFLLSMPETSYLKCIFLKKISI